MASGIPIEELVKLVIQFFGAACVSLITAWLTVRWALNRFKSEKIWERRVNAVADVVSALGDMQRIIGIWLDEVYGNRELSEKAEDELRVNFREASRRFESVIPLARFLMSPGTAKLLLSIEEDVEKAGRGAQNWHDHLDDQYGVIRGAIERLVTRSREELGLAALDGNMPRDNVQPDS